MKIATIVITCPGREASCRATIEALKATDWPETWPVVISCDEAVDGTRQHRQQMNALCGLRTAIELEPQFVLFLEDDVAFNAHLWHNLTHWQPLRDGSIGMASLYNPTISEMQRSSDQHWFKADAGAVYGSQAYVFSLETARFVAEHWHDIEGMQDIKMSRLASRGGWDIYYHVPSLVQHIGKASTWGGSYHSAPDFDPRFKTGHIGGAAFDDETRIRTVPGDRVRLKDYSEIPGWFNEEWLYDRIIGRVGDHATFVEVGCWLGKSTAYCAGRIRDTARPILFYAVDTWEGSPNEPAMREAALAAGGSVFELFRTNMEEAGVLESIRTLKMSSVAAAGLFENNTLDFVFIDADHSSEAVAADIAAWRPKVKSGGALAGHDWRTYGSVQQGVKAMLGQDFTVEGNCWIHERR